MTSPTHKAGCPAAECRYSTSAKERDDAWHGRKGGMKDQHRCLNHYGFQYEPNDERCYRADDACACKEKPSE